MQGECDIPEELRYLVESILIGPNGSNDAKKQRRTKAICSSIIFSMSNGTVKPSNCLHLGLALKSMTGSRKVVDILNRMGHSISYNVIEEIETELAYGSLDTRVLPGGLIDGVPTLHTHVAFDNFDRYVETASGKDTLHDTVGIVYQNIDEELKQNDFTNEENLDELSESRRRRKYMSQFGINIQPYIRKNKNGQCLFGNAPEIPKTLDFARELDYLWMLKFAYNTKGAKRWFGFNCDRVVDDNPIQKIGYLPNLNMSPTSDSVVKETLEIAKNIANECDQDMIIVNYDLAIASKAYKIQEDLAPLYKIVFVNLGAFHIQLSYFKVSLI